MKALILCCIFIGVLSAITFVLAGGCSHGTDDSPVITEVESRQSPDIPTVFHVSWTTNVETTGFVEFGVAPDGPVMTTAESQTPSTTHEATLIGLPAGTECFFRVNAQNPAGLTSVEEQTITTGNLPSGLPTLTRSGSGHDTFLIVPILGATHAVTIIDHEGRFVWWHFDERDLDIYRARLSIDGQSILYNAASVSGDPSDQSELVRISLDGSTISSIPIPLLAHDFVELSDGTLAAIVVEYRNHGDREIRGDSLVEVAPDGTQRTIWSAWDCFDIEETSHEEIDHGWTFANALDYDPAEDAYYLGLRNFSSIVKIPRSTGQCEWVLGNTASTLDFTSGSFRFYHQHQFDLQNGSILIFDNDGSTENESRVVEYSLDLEAGTATQTWTYQTTPSIFAFVLGDVQRVSNDDVLVTWSVAGQIERVTRSGEVTFQLNTDMGYAFGFLSIEESLTNGGN